MEAEGTKCVEVNEVAGKDDKRQLTAVLDDQWLGKFYLLN